MTPPPPSSVPRGHPELPSPDAGDQVAAADFITSGPAGAVRLKSDGNRGRRKCLGQQPSLEPAAGYTAREAMRRRAILSCLVGNFLELYDFTLYGFFAIFLGQTFFPSTS